MGSTPRSLHTASELDVPAEGSRRFFDQTERVFYSGYWIKTYVVPPDSLRAKKDLIEALTRRLFNHTEHGLNVPGARLTEARAAYETEADAAKRRVKGAMLAGALFNRATDIFRRLVELQADGIEIRADYILVQECGKCLTQALELGRLVRHRSGEEGIDELWGEPFRVFSLSLEEFYESRYIKISQAMRDIDRIAAGIAQNFGRLPVFAGIEPIALGFAEAARLKAETLRVDPDIFDIWSNFVTAGERLADFSPNAHGANAERALGRHVHGISDGQQLIRDGRDLMFHIALARTSMPKSTREYVERCEFYGQHGRVPTPAPHLPE